MAPKTDDVKDLTRGAAAVWRNRGVLAAVVGLVGLNVGGGVSTYFSGKKPSIDSLTVAQAVKAAMEPIRDTSREHSVEIREISKDLGRVAAQADKTETKLDNHLFAQSWPRPTAGRGREVNN